MVRLTQCKPLKRQQDGRLAYPGVTANQHHRTIDQATETLHALASGVVTAVRTFSFVASRTVRDTFVGDVVMPPLGLLIGGVDFSDLAITLKAAEGDVPAVVLAYGKFIQTGIDFLIVAFAIFMGGWQAAVHSGGDP